MQHGSLDWQLFFTFGTLIPVLFDIFLLVASIATVVLVYRGKGKKFFLILWIVLSGISLLSLVFGIMRFYDNLQPTAYLSPFTVLITASFLIGAGTLFAVYAVKPKKKPYDSELDKMCIQDFT